MALSDDQVTRVRQALTAAGVKWQCAACNDSRLELGRGVYALAEVARLGSQKGPEDGPERGSGPIGRVEQCVAVICGVCGYVRLHSLAALGLGDSP